MCGVLGDIMHNQSVRRGLGLIGKIRARVFSEERRSERHSRESDRDLLAPGSWLGAENERRAKLLHELYRFHAIETSGEGSDLVYRNALPPDAWVNAQLATRGETWRVQNVDGFRCEIYDVD